MNKKGFTILELTLTMGIIGVIAALTLPNLLQNAQVSQVGPRLAKAVVAFEHANKALLNSKGADKLTDIDFSDNAAYIKKLSDFLDIAIDYSSLDDESAWYLAKDGSAYSTSYNPTNIDDSLAFHKQKVGTIAIDINGKDKPNTDASDIFYFTLWNDGSVRAYGATNWNGEDNSNYGKENHWASACKANEIPTDKTLCAGHIFENDLKILYK